MRSLLARPRLALAALALVAVAALPAVAGPPWIAVEYPVNPFDQATRDAFLAVRTYHHGTEVGLPVRGRAEGIVKGARQTVTLRFDSTSRAGVVALRKQWPAEGTWVLVLEAAQGTDDTVTALVELGKDGLVRAVRVPTRREGRYLIPARVATTDVESLLRDAAARGD